MNTPKGPYKWLKNILKNLDKQNEELLENLDNNDTVKKEELSENIEEQEKDEIETNEFKETWKITHEHLLDKPNMTTKDKEGMQKAIDYLIENDMDTPENFKKLDAIIYAAEYIEIWGIQRAREDITANPNNKTILEHNGVTYFKWNRELIEEENRLLTLQNMMVPTDSDCEQSMKALPGEYVKWEHWYKGWNIIALILDMSKNGRWNSWGNQNTFEDEDISGYRWLNTTGYESWRFERDHAWLLCFSEKGGGLFMNVRMEAFPIRPIFSKQSLS